MWKRKNKIMLFDDRFGFTRSVLIGDKKLEKYLCHYQFNIESTDELVIKDIILKKIPHFEVGDIVAIAQPYSDLRFTPVECVRQGKIINISKAVVNPKYMEHHVVMEDVSLKRNSDFIEQDCLDMGIAKDISTGIPKYILSYSDSLSEQLTGYSWKKIYENMMKIRYYSSIFKDNPLMWSYRFRLFD